jgi:predicted ferric reductase
VFPLVVASTFQPAGASDTLLVNFSVALGYLGFTIMALELVLVSQFEASVWAVGLDTLQMFHKLVGIFAMALVLLHPRLLMIVGFPWRLFAGESGRAVDYSSGHIRSCRCSRIDRCFDMAQRDQDVV